MPIETIPSSSRAVQYFAFGVDSNKTSQASDPVPSLEDASVSHEQSRYRVGGRGSDRQPADRPRQALMASTLGEVRLRSRTLSSSLEGSEHSMANPGDVLTTASVASLIQDKIKEKRQPGKPIIIFVAGPSASGKSALTKALEKTEVKFESVKTDHFLKSFTQLSTIPGNKGPVANWSVVHGHADSFDRTLADRVLQELTKGKGASYELPSTYREGVMIGGYPRGERDTGGPHKTINIPASDTYLIEGISTPHLVKDASDVLVRLDCEFDETVKRRAGRGQDEAIPGNVKQAEDKGQYQAFQNSMSMLGVKPDVHLDSSGMTPGYFRVFKGEEGPLAKE